MANRHEVDELGVVVEKNALEGNPPLEPVEQPAVTGRPNDIPIDGPAEPAVANSTFAGRAKAAKKAAKQVDSDAAENKAVSSATTKSRRSAKRD